MERLTGWSHSLEYNALTMESALGASHQRTQPYRVPLWKARAHCTGTSAAVLKHLNAFSEKGGSWNSSTYQTAALHKQTEPTQTS